MASTVSKKVDSKPSTVENLTEEALEELFKGAPDDFSDAGEETQPIESVAVADPVIAPDTVMLTNIKFRDEEILIPDAESNRWSGRKVQFIDYRLVTDPVTAALVKAACPYVYEENLDMPVSQWFEHQETNFKTTVPKAFSEYSRSYAESR